MKQENSGTGLYLLKLYLWLPLVALSLYFLREVFFVAFLGLVMAVVLSFPVNLFSKFLRRGRAVLVTLLLVLAGGGLLFYSLVEPITEQARRIEEKLPEAVRNARTWLHRQQAGLTQATSAKTPADKTPPVNVENWASAALDKAKSAVAGLISAVSLAVIVFVLSLFFVHEPEVYRRELRSLVPREREATFDELWKRAGTGLRHWVGGISLAMLMMGGFCALGLWAIGVQNWLLLGIITLFATFIPYAGAIASAIPGLLMALAQSGETFLLACGVYLGVHLLEGYVVQPLIMKKAVTLPPATLLVWQFALGIFGGILGIVVATPLFVCLKIALDYLYVEKALGKAPYPKMPEVGSGTGAPVHKKKSA